MKNMALLIPLFSLLLPGCRQEPEVITATEYVKQPWVYRKPGADIELENSQVNLEVSGAEYAIDPGFISAYSKGDLELSVTASEGLYIVEGDTHYNMALSKGKLSSPLNVIAAETGRYYLYVNAKVDNDGMIENRALTFIVQVGNDYTSSKDALAPSSKTSAEGEVIVPLTAQEEIIQH